MTWSKVSFKFLSFVHLLLRILASEANNIKDYLKQCTIIIVIDTIKCGCFVFFFSSFVLYGFEDLENI